LFEGALDAFLVNGCAAGADIVLEEVPFHATVADVDLRAGKAVRVKGTAFKAFMLVSLVIA
jgi:hypothetical protein